MTDSKYTQGNADRLHRIIINYAPGFTASEYAHDPELVTLPDGQRVVRLRGSDGTDDYPFTEVAELPEAGLTITAYPEGNFRCIDIFRTATREERAENVAHALEQLQEMGDLLVHDPLPAVAALNNAVDGIDMEDDDTVFEYTSKKSGTNIWITASGSGGINSSENLLMDLTQADMVALEEFFRQIHQAERRAEVPAMPMEMRQAIEVASKVLAVASVEGVRDRLTPEAQILWDAIEMGDGRYDPNSRLFFLMGLHALVTTPGAAQYVFESVYANLAAHDPLASAVAGLAMPRRFAS